MEIKIEELVNTYSKMVFQIAYQNCFIKSNAEDITQEVIIKLWKNIEKFKTEEHLKSWLIRVTINTSIDNNRYYKNKKETQLEENDDYYFEKEYHDLLEKLKKLKPIKRNIIYLYYYQGYKIKEISKILNINANTVNTNLARAKKELKNILEEGGEYYEV